MALIKADRRHRRCRVKQKFSLRVEKHDGPRQLHRALTADVIKQAANDEQ
jgi:hypothetical protein